MFQPKWMKWGGIGLCLAVLVLGCSSAEKLTKRDVNVGLGDLRMGGQGMVDQVEGFVYVPARAQGRDTCGGEITFETSAPIGSTPVAGASVTLYDAQGNVVGSTTTDANGGFTVNVTPTPVGTQLRIEVTWESEPGQPCNIVDTVELGVDVLPTHGGYGWLHVTDLADIGATDYIERINYAGFKATDLSTSTPQLGMQGVVVFGAAGPGGTNPYTEADVQYFLDHPDQLTYQTQSGQMLYRLFDVTIQPGENQVAHDNLSIANGAALMALLRQANPNFYFLAVGRPTEGAVRLEQLVLSVHVSLL